MAEDVQPGAGAGARPRLLIIGIDSATFRIIRPLAEAGHLPTFKRLLDEGAHGKLLSTLPPVTPPGWVSSYTGVNPGKHGIFDFKDHMKYVRSDLPYEFGTTSAASVRAEPFWSILNRHGRTAGLFNLPMTYPVEPVDGYLVAGFPAGDDDGGLFHPPELAREVRGMDPRFTTYVERDEMSAGDPRAYLDRVNRVEGTRAQVSLALMRSRPTDVVFHVFNEVDRVQHYFWYSWAEDHPTHGGRREVFKDAFKDHYQVIDRGIDAMMDLAGPKVPVIVYSDHGAAAFTTYVYVNSYLAKKGLIVFKGQRAGGPGRGDEGVMRERLLDRRSLERLFKRLGWERYIHLIPRSIRGLLPKRGIDTVDWSRTRAYFSSQAGRSVTVNLRGRQPEGCVEPGEEYDAVVEEVLTLLRDLRDPRTGTAPVTEALPRDQLYEGPFVDIAPDVVFSLAEGYMAFKGFPEDVFYDVGETWDDQSGEHEREGVLIMWGEGVRRGHHLRDRPIEDIAPTVLHLCGLEVPRYMDGKVIEEALDEGWLRDHPVRLTGPDEFVPQERERSAMSDEEEELLKDRLRGLGYM